MSTAATTISGLTNSTQKTATQKATLAADFDQFLTLLTTQLQNQDPLNPMDSNDFTNQLVQFSQVEQQINTNQKLDSLLSLQLSSSISAALGYVGLDASYVSNEMNYDGEKPVSISYSLAAQAKTAKMTILDGDGNKVLTKDIGLETGRQNYTWDGKDEYGQKMAAGTYTVKIDALDANNKTVTSTVVVNGNVRGVETQDGQILLLVGERSVPMANILNASVPKTTTTTAATN